MGLQTLSTCPQTSLFPDFVRRPLQVNHGKVSRQEPILQNTTIWNGDLLSFVGDNDDCSSKGHVSTEINIASDRQMIKLNNVRNRFESFLELCDLLEVVAEFDDRASIELSEFVQNQFPVFQGVYVRFDEQKVRAALDRQESAPRDVYTVSLLEMLDSCSSGSLKLNDGRSIVCGFGVDNYVQIHTLILDNSLQSFQVDP